MISKEENIDLTHFDKVVFYIEEHSKLKLNVEHYDEGSLHIECVLSTNLDKEIEKLLINSELFRPSFMRKDKELGVYFAYPNFMGVTEETLILEQDVSITFKVPRKIIYDIETFHNDNDSRPEV